MDHSTAVRIAQGGEGAIVSELLRLSDEIEKLSHDRKEVLEYLEAVRHCTSLHPDGYTIVDFQRVWLGQKDEEIEKRDREIEWLKSKLEEAQDMCSRMVNRR